MAAVLRVKRRCDEYPHEVLLLSCKRKKQDDVPEHNEPSYTTLLKRTGTINTQEEDVVQHIPKKAKSNARASLKRVANVLEKIRAESRATSSENRYKVVNCFRALNTLDTTDGDSEAQCKPNGEDKLENHITVVDIEKGPLNEKEDCSDSTEVMEGSSDTKSYVYDLYYAEKVDFDDMLLDTQLSIHPMESDFTYEEEEDDEDKFPFLDDDSDSNDENNWRNDYPDSENSITEDDMMLAVQIDDMNLGNELSSDDGEEGYIYSQDADADDIRRYGSPYARYKRRMINELASSESDDSDAS